MTALLLTDAGLDVSRETLDQLNALVALVEHWTRRINLISPDSEGDIWTRHIIDSLQIYPLAPDFAHWVDLGSGGGFPGLVIAIVAGEKNPGSRFTLIESDARKSVFLRTAIRELSLAAKVETQRIELAAPQNGDVVSARALAALPGLMPMVKRHIAADGTALLMKGERYGAELDAIRADWHFDLTEYPSITHPTSRILSFKGITRAS